MSSTRRTPKGGAVLGSRDVTIKPTGKKSRAQKFFQNVPIPPLPEIKYPKTSGCLSPVTRPLKPPKQDVPNYDPDDPFVQIEKATKHIGSIVTNYEEVAENDHLRMLQELDTSFAISEFKPQDIINHSRNVVNGLINENKELKETQSSVLGDLSSWLRREEITLANTREASKTEDPSLGPNPSDQIQEVMNSSATNQEKMVKLIRIHNDIVTQSSIAIHKLQKRGQEQNNLIKELQKQLNERPVYKAKEEKVDTEKIEMEKKLELANGTILDQDNKIKELNKRIESLLIQSCQTSRSEAYDDGADFLQKQQEVHELKMEIDNLQSELSKKINETYDLKSQIRVLNADKGSLNEQIQSLKNMLDLEKKKFDGQIRELILKKDDTIKSARESTKAIQGNLKVITDLNKEIVQLQEEVVKVREESQVKFNREVETMRKEFEMREIENMKRKATEAMDESYKSMVDQIQDYNTKQREILKSTYEDKIKRLLADKEKEIDELKRMHKAELADLEETFKSDLKKAVGENGASVIEKYEKEAKDKEIELTQQYENRLSMLRQDINNSKAEYEKQQLINEQLIEDLRRQLIATESINDHQKKKIAELEENPQIVEVTKEIENEDDKNKLNELLAQVAANDEMKAHIEDEITNKILDVERKWKQRLNAQKTRDQEVMDEKIENIVTAAANERYGMEKNYQDKIAELEGKLNGLLQSPSENYDELQQQLKEARDAAQNFEAQKIAMETELNILKQAAQGDDQSKMMFDLMQEINELKMKIEVDDQLSKAKDSENENLKKMLSQAEAAALKTISFRELYSEDIYSKEPKDQNEKEDEGEIKEEDPYNDQRVVFDRKLSKLETDAKSIISQESNYSISMEIGETDGTVNIERIKTPIRNLEMTSNESISKTPIKRLRNESLSTVVQIYQAPGAIMTLSRTTPIQMFVALGENIEQIQDQSKYTKEQTHTEPGFKPQSPKKGGEFVPVSTLSMEQCGQTIFIEPSVSSISEDIPVIIDRVNEMVQVSIVEQKLPPRLSTIHPIEVFTKEGIDVRPDVSPIIEPGLNLYSETKVRPKRLLSMGGEIIDIPAVEEIDQQTPAVALSTAAQIAIGETAQVSKNLQLVLSEIQSISEEADHEKREQMQATVGVALDAEKDGLIMQMRERITELEQIMNKSKPKSITLQPSTGSIDIIQKPEVKELSIGMPEYMSAPTQVDAIPNIVKRPFTPASQTKPKTPMISETTTSTTLDSLCVSDISALEMYNDAPEKVMANAAAQSEVIMIVDADIRPDNTTGAWTIGTQTVDDPIATYCTNETQTATTRSTTATLPKTPKLVQKKYGAELSINSPINFSLEESVTPRANEDVENNNDNNNKRPFIPPVFLDQGTEFVAENTGRTGLSLVRLPSFVSASSVPSHIHMSLEQELDSFSLEEAPLPSKVKTPKFEATQSIDFIPEPNPEAEKRQPVLSFSRPATSSVTVAPTAQAKLVEPTQNPTEKDRKRVKLQLSPSKTKLLEQEEQIRILREKIDELQRQPTVEKLQNIDQSIDALQKNLKESNPAVIITPKETEQIAEPEKDPSTELRIAVDSTSKIVEKAIDEQQAYNESSLNIAQRLQHSSVNFLNAMKTEDGASRNEQSRYLNEVSQATAELISANDAAHTENLHMNTIQKAFENAMAQLEKEEQLVASLRKEIINLKMFRDAPSALTEMTKIDNELQNIKDDKTEGNTLFTGFRDAQAYISRACSRLKDDGNIAAVGMQAAIKELNEMVSMGRPRWNDVCEKVHNIAAALNSDLSRHRTKELVDNLNKQIQELTLENTDMRRDRIMLERDLGVARDRLDREISHFKEALDVANSHIAMLEKHSKGPSMSIPDLASNNSDIVESLRKELDISQNLNNQNLTEIQRLITKQNDLEKKSADLEAKLRDKEAKYLELFSESSDTQTNKQILEQRVAELLKRAEMQENKAQALEKIRDEVVIQVEKLNEQLTNVLARSEAERKQLIEAQARIEELQNEILNNKANEMVKKLPIGNDETKKMFRTYQNRVEQYQQMLQKRSNEIIQLRSHRADDARALVLSRAEIQRLKNEARIQAVRYEGARDEIEMLRRQVSGRDDTIRALKREIERLRILLSQQGPLKDKLRLSVAEQNNNYARLESTRRKLSAARNAASKYKDNQQAYSYFDGMISRYKNSLARIESRAREIKEAEEKSKIAALRAVSQVVRESELLIPESTILQLMPKPKPSAHVEAQLQLNNIHEMAQEDENSDPLMDQHFTARFNERPKFTVMQEQSYADTLRAIGNLVGKQPPQVLRQMILNARHQKVVVPRKEFNSREIVPGLSVTPLRVRK